MNRPLPPLFFVGVFLLVLIAAVLMLAQVMSRQEPQAQSTPKAALALQLALVQEGDAVGLRLTCVEGIRGDVTAEAVAKAQAVYAGKTLEDLVASITDESREDGPPHRLARTPEGRVLTRLVLVSGEWLAESAWRWSLAIGT